MNISAELAKLSQFMPVDKLQPKVDTVLRFITEPVTHVLKSTALGGDAPVLSALFVVTQRLICEVRLAEGAQKFDFVSKTSIKNYRVRLWDQEISEGGVVRAKYELADIELSHELSSSFVTNFTYAGTARDEWITEIKSAIPVESVT